MSGLWKYLLIVLAFAVYRMYKSRYFLYTQGSMIETQLGWHDGFWTRMRDRMDVKKGEMEASEAKPVKDLFKKKKIL